MGKSSLELAHKIDWLLSFYFMFLSSKLRLEGTLSSGVLVHSTWSHDSYGTDYVNAIIISRSPRETCGERNNVECKWIKEFLACHVKDTVVGLSYWCSDYGRGHRNLYHAWCTPMIRTKESLQANVMLDQRHATATIWLQLWGGLMWIGCCFKQVRVYNSN